MEVTAVTYLEATLVGPFNPNFDNNLTRLNYKKLKFCNSHDINIRINLL